MKKHSFGVAFNLGGRSGMNRKYTFGRMLFDFVMTIVTGGFWLIWVLIKYLRTH